MSGAAGWLSIDWDDDNIIPCLNLSYADGNVKFINTIFHAVYEWTLLLPLKSESGVPTYTTPVEFV